MNIRSVLLSAASVLIMAGAASAADLPRRAPAAAPYYAAPVPVFTWTGFYLGLNAGAAFNGSNNNAYTSNGFGIAPTIYAPTGGNNTGFTGGGQIGYNWQTSSFVFGLETDIQGVSRGNSNVAVLPIILPGTYAVATPGNRANWFGTVRGRAGFAVDRALFYVTGGFAYGGNNGGGSVTYFPPLGPATVYSPGSNSSKVGWTLGGGVEYALSNNWSLKGEYLYVDLGGNNNSVYRATGTATTFSGGNQGDRFHVVRAGLNYKF